MDYTNGFLQCKCSLGPLRWNSCEARVEGQWGLKESVEPVRALD